MNSEEQEINKDLILREKLAVQRTILANQVTLLSFIRTALYFLVAGLSLKSLLKIENSIVLEVILFTAAAAIMVYGIVNFYIHNKAIKKSEIHIGNFRMEYLKK